VKKALYNFWENSYNDYTFENDGKKVSFNKTALLFSMPSLCFKIKESAYDLEKEWRLCKNVFNEDKLKFEIKSNLLIPYYEHFFEKEIIKKIIVGPCSNGELLKRTILMFLRKYNYKISDESVILSEMPYRKI
jgi:hypothetical protein